MAARNAAWPNNHQRQRVGRPQVASWAETEITLAADLGDGTYFNELLGPVWLEYCSLPVCWAGTATAVTSQPGCRSCRPTWATWSRPTPYWYLHAAPELLAEPARRVGPGPGAAR
jgi:hypothetical protein